jgi:biopolymer transport protein ExbD
MSPIKRPDESRIMLEMNTTPLIDVLLVLLVMLIITIPVATHSVKLDLPGPTRSIPVRALSNVLSVDRGGALAWNGAPISPSDLRSALDQVAAMPMPPELHLRPAPDAPYGAVDAVLAATKRAQLTRVGFVGNEAYRDF